MPKSQIKKHNPQTAFRLGGANMLGLLRCGIGMVQKSVQEKDFLTQQYAMVLIVSGNGYLVDDKGRHWPLERGSVFQRFPGRKHTAFYEATVNRAYLAVPAQVYELFNITGAPLISSQVFSVDNVAQAVSGFETIYKTLSASQPHDIADCQMDMQKFMLELLKKGKSPEGYSVLQEEIILASRVLGENLSESLSMPDVALKIGMSYSLFRKEFVRQTGFSPAEFRIRRRIEQAMSLLSGRTKPLKEIADELGYSDVYAFCTQFKKIIGVPPGEFRRNTSSHF